MGRQLRGMLLSPFLRQRLALLRVQGARDRLRAADRADRGWRDHPERWTAPSRSRTLREAMRLLETGQVRGKIAITV